MEILKNLEIREKATAVALAIGMVALGYQMAEDYLEKKVDEWFEESSMDAVQLDNDIIHS